MSDEIIILPGKPEETIKVQMTPWKCPCYMVVIVSYRDNGYRGVWEQVLGHEPNLVAEMLTGVKAW